MGLTEREQKILRLNAVGLSDYQIAKKLKIETPNVYRARKTALSLTEQELICHLLTALARIDTPIWKKVVTSS
ncbi:MAG: LuxR C-terminal-related transcriptional regulator [Candidatus Bathyarchaeia archaeon]|jgi:DNA-binding CsgD family transcriptional regulator